MTGMLRRLRAGAKDTRGQMTVEMAIVFPVAVIVAVIGVNAVMFFSECAQFDRVARNAVRICATSPAYEQSLDQSVAAVQAILDREMDRENIECTVEASSGGSGYASFEAALAFRPTLFGLGLKESVFGVALPALTHRVVLVVDTYKPGMLF